MKTKFKHILVILCLSMISCEGNLEPELFDQITPENFLTNEDDVKTAVTGVYAEFRGISEWGRYKTSWGSVMTLQEVPTDLWAANWFYKAHTDFMWKATDYFVCEIFEFFVPAITKATALIARIQDAPVSDDIKNRYIAELRVVIIRKSKFPQNPKRSVRFSGKRTKRSVQKRKARNTQKAETKVL